MDHAEDKAAAKEAFEPEEGGVLPKRRRLAEGESSPLNVANVQTYKDVVASVLKTCLLSSPQLHGCPLKVLFSHAAFISFQIVLDIRHKRAPQQELDPSCVRLC